MHVYMMQAFFRTNEPTDQRTNKGILGIGLASKGSLYLTPAGDTQPNPNYSITVLHLSKMALYHMHDNHNHDNQYWIIVNTMFKITIHPVVK